MAAASARATALLASGGISTAGIVVTDAPAAYGNVTVTIAYNAPLLFSGFIPGLSGSTFPLSGTTTMRREY